MLCVSLPCMDKLDILQKHISLKVDIDSVDLDRFVALTIPRTIEKGEFFIRTGQVARYQAFVLKGVLASYSIDTKGEKHVVQIAIEGHWISDLYSFLSKEPAVFTVEALEKCELLLMSLENHERACNEIPVFERFFRLLIQNALVQHQRRISNIYSESAEDRYLNLIKEKPEIAQSVPQHYLASFLGIKPQSLSRIRKQMSQKTE